MSNVCDVVEVRPAFNFHGSKYDDYEYWEGHRPFSVWNERQIVKGVHVNPCLPRQFEAYPLENRGKSELDDWYDRAFIRTNTIVDAEHGRVYLSFDVRCLDGGAWDRSTWKFSTENLNEAIRFAQEINDERENYYGS